MNPAMRLAMFEQAGSSATTALLYARGEFATLRKLIGAATPEADVEVERLVELLAEAVQNVSTIELEELREAVKVAEAEAEEAADEAEAEEARADQAQADLDEAETQLKKIKAIVAAEVKAANKADRGVIKNAALSQALGRIQGVIDAEPT